MFWLSSSRDPQTNTNGLHDRYEPLSIVLSHATYHTTSFAWFSKVPQTMANIRTENDRFSDRCRLHVSMDASQVVITVPIAETMRLRARQKGCDMLQSYERSVRRCSELEASIPSVASLP